MNEKTSIVVNDSDKTEWHEFGKDGCTPVGVVDVRLVRQILNTYTILIIGKIPYIYEDGVFRPDETETKLKEIIQLHLFDKVININTVNRVYNLIISTNSIQAKYEDMNKYPRRWINFKNCMFDPLEWKEIPHNPMFRSINQIPHEFHMDDIFEGEVTKNFIEFAIPDETDREMLWQYFGYCLTSDSSLQKFMIFKGQGGTGKSQLIKIVEAMVGRDNISNISIQQLNERFFPYMLLGKLLNSCADIPSKAMESVAEIKKITGEDLILAEKKGKDVFSFYSYAKLIFSANEIPINIDEKSEALYRRMLIVKVERKPEKKNPNLWSELEKEINYSLTTSVQALHRMYKQGKFTESKNSTDSVQELYMEADTVTAFLFERTKKMDGKTTKSSDLYDEYKKYCEDNDRRFIGRNSFHKTMSNKGYVKKRAAGYDKYENLVILEQDYSEEFVSISEVDQADLPFM